MLEVDLIDIGFNRHLIRCPHCQKQTVYNWPGDMILFAMAKCSHCGRAFLIKLNKPWLAS
jgi:DNA-directed RNA polymerase subunit RPC12/RpoP